MGKGKKSEKRKADELHVPPGEQLTEQEKADLYSALLRCNGLHERMLEFLTAEVIGGESDKYQLLVTACHRLRKENISPAEKGYKRRLKTTVRNLASVHGEDDPQCEAGEELLADDGLIQTAFAADPTEFEPGEVQKLLKRYLYQRYVAEPLESFLDTALSQQVMPGDWPALLDQIGQRVREVEQLDTQPVRTVGDRWKDHNARLKQTRGKKMAGLKTGLTELDRRTLGLRGLFILAAKPGVGKTTFNLQVGVGICRHHVDNDAAVVVVSLDMAAADLMDRLHSHLGQLDWNELKFGSREDDRQPGKLFSKAAADKLAEAERRLEEDQVDRRLVILDRTDLGEHVTAARLSALVQEAKRTAKAKRALLVVDYLQLIPVIEEETASDVAADKARVRLVQQVIERSRTAENPQGDAAVLISEARKPPNAKEKWGSGLAELMGSARLAYAADAVLLYAEMSDKQLADRYGVNVADAGVKRKALLDQGIVPLMLNLEKGRDGMRRGMWPVEFHYRTSTFVEHNATAAILKTIPPADDENEGTGDSPRPKKGSAKSKFSSLKSFAKGGRSSTKPGAGKRKGGAR